MPASSIMGSSTGLAAGGSGSASGGSCAAAGWRPFERTPHAVGTNHRPYSEKAASSKMGRILCNETLLL
jgi:hypothetical protein